MASFALTHSRSSGLERLERVDLSLSVGANLAPANFRFWTLKQKYAEKLAKLQEPRVRREAGSLELVVTKGLTILAGRRGRLDPGLPLDPHRLVRLRRLMVNLRDHNTGTPRKGVSEQCDRFALRIAMTSSLGRNAHWVGPGGRAEVRGVSTALPLTPDAIWDQR